MTEAQACRRSCAMMCIGHDSSSCTAQSSMHTAALRPGVVGWRRGGAKASAASALERGREKCVDELEACEVVMTADEVLSMPCFIQTPPTLEHRESTLARRRLSHAGDAAAHTSSLPPSHRPSSIVTGQAVPLMMTATLHGAAPRRCSMASEQSSLCASGSNLELTITG
jgi:hypothetical protein